MIKFFRKIRYKLLNEQKLNKYIFYAIGEILLVVIGILIAVGIGEWRTNIKKEKELIGYYQGLSYDLNQDKNKLDSLITLYDKTIIEVVKEIDMMQLNSYNEDSLYSNVTAWMVYTIAFAPNKTTFTEVVSSGKLQLFKNKDLKSQILNVYGNLYPELLFRQNTVNDFITKLRTIELIDTYRWMKILDNDDKRFTDVILENPKYHINHDWLKDKNSDKYLKFENYLNLIRTGYLDKLIRYKKIKKMLEELVILIDEDIERISSR